MSSLTYSGYREIITKAICGSGRKQIQFIQNLPVPEEHHPHKILGVSITQFRVDEPAIIESFPDQAPSVKLSGSFEIHVWYAYDNGTDTDILRQNVAFEETVLLAEYDNRSIKLVDARVVITRPPTCVDSSITAEHHIQLKIEMAAYVEVVGETKIMVQVFEPGNGTGGEE